MSPRPYGVLAACMALCLCVVVACGTQPPPSSSPPPQTPAAPPVAGTIDLPGLSAPVRVVRDRWGVPHIFASTTGDLFFAQGFVQAEDRLFQMDLWRRSSQGRLAEVLGANFIGRDVMTRAVQYHGELEGEWASYGPDTKAIADAFVRGINAWVAAARDHPPEAFALAGWRPEFWRAEDLLARTDAFTISGNAATEVLRARVATALGRVRADRLFGDSRSTPATDLDPAIVTFAVGDALRQIGAAPFFVALAGPVRGTGSNAWAITSARSTTGGSIVAVDPHRPFANPSLRYLIHLSAPGWNVIGATAPWMPGVAIGHNDRMAWGMTAFDADSQDLFVERLNPANPHQVEDRGRWRNTTVIVEPLWVKGRSTPASIEREYTPHGVVVAVDGEKHLAFTLQWSGFERGAAGELAALGLDRALSTTAFREALQRWKMPAVDVVYAERGGAIGSDVAASVPVRRGWDGSAPVPGWTGQFEWTGWLAGAQHALNPQAGYVVSANDSRPRVERLRNALAGTRLFGIDDFTALQFDVLAMNAAHLVPLVARLHASREDVESARLSLVAWDRRVSVDSTIAPLYVSWERLATRMLVAQRLPANLIDEFVAHRGDMAISALIQPSSDWFDGDPVRARDALLMDALAMAVDERQTPHAHAGGETWGSLHAVLFAHPLAVTDAARTRFNVGPVPIAGYGGTLMVTSGRGFEATVGASFRAIFDTADWDRSVAQNAPGQSGNPASAHFGDLVATWAAGQYFPLSFGEAAVQQTAESTLTLVPSPK